MAQPTTPRVQDHHYGSSEIGTPYYTRERCYIRIDVYTSPSGEVTPQRVFCLNSQDTTDQVDHPYGSYPGNRNYDSACASCYLAHAHTLAYHDHLLDHEREWRIG